MKLNIKKKKVIILEKIFRGSVSDLLLKFVKEEKISKKDLEELLEKIDKEVK